MVFDEFVSFLKVPTDAIAALAFVLPSVPSAVCGLVRCYGLLRPMTNKTVELQSGGSFHNHGEGPY